MRRKKSEKGKAATTTDVEPLALMANEPKQAASIDEQPPLPLEAQEPVATHEPGRDAGKTDYPPEPNPRPWRHSNQAGVELRTRRDPYHAELVFKEKPPQKAIDYVKANGFQWNLQEKFWWRPIGFKTAAQDRLIATRAFHRVVELILEEKGLAPEKELARAT